MIELTKRGASALLTVEDFCILHSYRTSKEAAKLAALDRADAERMFMLVDSSYSAAKEKTTTDRGDRC
jgi:hypothetical protein